LKTLPLSYQEILKRAAGRVAINKLTLQKYSRSKKILPLQEYTQKAFETVKCLDCANCCKNLGPALLPTDLPRMAAGLQISVTALLKKYILMDEDGDFTVNALPCPFLGEDLYCKIYEFRPRSCREYPHTADRNFKKLTNLHLNNAETCPAVQLVLDKIDTALAIKD